MDMICIGYPIMALGLIFCFFYPDKLYALTIFFIPFTGTAVMHISGESFDGAYVTPSMFLGALCLARHFFEMLFSSRQIGVSGETKWPLLFVLLLCVVCVSSLIMPIIIDKEITLKDFYKAPLLGAKEHLIHFKFQYVTQVGYLVFGGLLTYYLVVKNLTYSKIIKTVNIYIYASIFIAFWGLMEVVLFYMDSPHPGLFNRSSCTGMYTSEILNGRPRIVSAALESFIMAQQLLTTLPLLFFRIENWKTWKDQIILKIGFIVIFIVLLLSTSTTAMVVLPFFVVLVVYDSIRDRIKPRTIIILVILVVTSGLLVGYILYQKIATTYSGQERFFSFTYAWSRFLDYPILGIGWGTLQVFDLVLFIASTMGTLGLIIFLMLLFSIGKNFAQRTINNRYVIVRRILLYSFLLLLAASEFSGWVFYLHYFWLILGLAIAGSALGIDSVIEGKNRLRELKNAAKGTIVYGYE